MARDATFQHLLGGTEFAAGVIRERAGGAFDPAIAALLADEAAAILALDRERSAWEEVLAAEPGPALILRGPAIEEALAAMGDFADLISPYLVGHAAGVAELAGTAAQRLGFPAPDAAAIRRAVLATTWDALPSRHRYGTKPGR